MSKVVTGKITDWDEKRGFGFVDQGGNRVFLHIREYTERHHFPRIGDRVSFLFGKDEKGRTCAKEVRLISSSSRLRGRHFLFLSALLFLPIFAVMKLSVDLLITAPYLVVLSSVSWIQYAADKKRAEQRAWRISEMRLHLVDFLGGWPGGYLAQEHLRHKTRKEGFQFIFWFIVILYQVVSLDYLGDWSLWNLFRETVESLGQ